MISENDLFNIEDRAKDLGAFSSTAAGPYYAGQSAADVPALVAEVRRLNAELAEMQSLLDLQQARMETATARWRAEAPDERAQVLPDLGKLLAWLMTQADVASVPVETQYDDLIVRTWWDINRMELHVDQAPDVALCTAKRLQEMHTWRVIGSDRINVGIDMTARPPTREPVWYRITGWDPHHKALIITRERIAKSSTPEADRG